MPDRTIRVGIDRKHTCSLLIPLSPAGLSRGALVYLWEGVGKRPTCVVCKLKKKSRDIRGTSSVIFFVREIC